MNSLLYEDLSYKIRGCVFHVYNTLGPGHKENIYQQALAKTFLKQRINFDIEESLNVLFEGEVVGKYRPDFLIEHKIILELKSLPFLTISTKRQVVSYLKATKLHLGFVINFGSEKLEIQRVVN